jgi:hypothetical protein
MSAEAMLNMSGLNGSPCKYLSGLYDFFCYRYGVVDSDHVVDQDVVD